MSASDAPSGIDHGDVAMAGRRTCVADRVRLRRLALAIAERAAAAIGTRAADEVHGVPELGCADLVCDVLQHAADTTIADLIERLAAELRVVSLLVDREAAVAVDQDAVLD